MLDVRIDLVAARARAQQLAGIIQAVDEGTDVWHLQEQAAQPPVVCRLILEWPPA